jgi:hypothetical protein
MSLQVFLSVRVEPIARVPLEDAYLIDKVQSIQGKAFVHL